MEERYLIPREIADTLRVDILTVYQWLRTGKLRGYKAGGVWRIKESDLTEFLQKGRRRQ